MRMIVAPSADLDMAVRAIVFAAVGTAGQRCTTLRRLFVHRSIRADLTHRLRQDLFEPADRRPARGRHAGRPADRPGRARAGCSAALKRAQEEGGKRPRRRACRQGVPNGGAYVEPAIVEMPDQTGYRARGDLRADPLYAAATTTWTKRSRIHNDVPQGLSSSIFTLDLREAETFLSAAGIRLRHRQRQYRALRRRDRRRVRRRKGDRRRPRERLRRLEGLYAPADQHGELFGHAAAGAGGAVRFLASKPNWQGRFRPWLTIGISAELFE